MTHLEIAIKAENENLRLKIEIMRQIATCNGFFQYYFDLLKSSKTNAQAFSKVNKIYFQFFGVKRYSNFQSFLK